MAISMATYEQVALEDDDVVWELECGQLLPKSPMTWEHSDIIGLVHVALVTQLDLRLYAVRGNIARVLRGKREESRRLEVYDEPLPLIVEVWSPSTGGRDSGVKLQGYQERGDVETWLIHPYERTLTAWRRQPDGGYTETLIREGIVEPVALPGVRVALADLFA